MPLIDKALVRAETMELTPGGDFKTVSDNEAELQAAQNRCVAHLGSWVHDPTFGNQLYVTLRENSPSQLTDESVRAHIEAALQPMINEGRLKNLNDVKIVEVRSDSIWIEVSIQIGTRIGEIIFPVPV